jgi:hypothetical protein
VNYDPYLYADKFEGVIEVLDKPAIPEDESGTETASAHVTISPNPANPSTTIAFSLTSSSNVKLAVYSVSGQKIATLVNDFMPAGSHVTVFDGSSLASGVYLYRFETTGYAASGKFVLVK